MKSINDMMMVNYNNEDIDVMKNMLEANGVEQLKETLENLARCVTEHKKEPWYYFDKKSLNIINFLNFDTLKNLCLTTYLPVKDEKIEEFLILLKNSIRQITVNPKLTKALLKKTYSFPFRNLITT